MAKKSFKTSLMILGMTLVLLTSVVLGVSSIVSVSSSTNMALENYDVAMNDGYNNLIKAQVQAVITVLQAEYDKYQAGELTEAEAKAEAAEIVRAMRYLDDQSGYFWIDDTDYILVMHPILPQNEGNNRYDLTDPNGVKIVQSILASCTSPEGGGFNEFYFTKSDGVTVAPKVAYSEMFEPWGWMVSTGNYVDDMSLEMEAVHTQIGAHFIVLCGLILICIIAMLIVAFVVSRIYGNILCKPLIEIQNLANRLSKGDLTTPVNVKQKNELGATASALNEAQTHIVALISSLSKTAKDLSGAVESFTGNFSVMGESIENVATAVGEIAKNSTSQAMATTNATESIISMADGISQTSKVVEALDVNAKSMQDSSRKSMKTLEELITINTDTKADIDEMYQQTENTNESVKKISQAATLISEIASQTNLLSLNASIEAARAGEAGRGFAVVAGEIGSLATQSANTASEINSIIGELIDNSAKSVAIMQKMNEASGHQVEALKNTNSMFAELEQSLNSCVNSVNSIAELIEHVNNQRDKVTNNINELNHLATDNAASTEETSSMAEQLEAIVGQSDTVVNALTQDITLLNDNMGQFKLSPANS